MKNTRRYTACAVLAALILVSFFGLSRVLSSPEFHAGSIQALDKRKVTVMEMTTATAVSSVAIAAIPGDATTPIADQIAELSGYLLIVTGVIMLEKFLLTLTGCLAFKVLIPIACALGILYQFVPRTALKQMAIRLGAFGLAICFIIPASLRVGDLFEETFQLYQTVSDAERATEDIRDAADESSGKETGGISGWFSQIGEQITSGVTEATEKAKEALNHFIDAVAVLVISNCVIPVLVLFAFLWLTKFIVALPFEYKGEKKSLFRSKTTG